MTTSFRLWPRTYVYPALDSPNKPYGDSLSDYLREIRNPWSGLHNLHQGTRVLHSSYLTWFYNRRNPQPDHNAKETLARCMRHNWTIAETNYRKLPIEQIRRKQSLLLDVQVATTHTLVCCHISSMMAASGLSLDQPPACLPAYLPV